MAVISLEYFKSIAKTVPISYYAKRAISLTVSDKESSSFYNPFKDAITLSYAAMAHMFDKMKDDSPEIEEVIRSVIYHEVSHALITPKDLMGGHCRYTLWRNAMNVIEDERIETVFRNFYLNTNFRKSIILLNNYTGGDPDNAFNAFYYAVRFKYGKKELVYKANKLVSRFIRMNKKDGYYNVIEFQEATWNLVIECARDWYENNDLDALLAEDPNYESLDDNLKNKVVERVLTKENPEGGVSSFSGGESGEGEGDSSSLSGDPDKGDSDSVGKGFTGVGTPTHNPGEDPDEMGGGAGEDGEDEAPDVDSILSGIEKGNDEAGGGIEISEDDFQEMWETALNEFNDDKLTQKIDFIITSAQRKDKKASSTACRGYSGRIDPKAIGRDDWKIFIRKCDHGDIKGFGKLHLNLFIDTSGSYYNNETSTNKILKSLDILERRYPFFDFDLVTCQISERMQDRDHRYIHAEGGNDLDEKIWDIFKKLQRKDAYNYNIALFDGDAFSDSYYIHRNEDMKPNFGAFNVPNCTIISDTDNKKAIETYAPKANHIWAGRGYGSGSYSEMLFENILTALHRILI